MTEVHYHGVPKPPPPKVTYLSRIKGAIRGEVPQVEHRAEKSLNQAIDIATGEINIAHIIKYAILFVVFCGIMIFLINLGRGFMITGQQVSCNLGNFGCIGGCRFDCEVDSPSSDITMVNWLWDIEWIFRCLFYLGCALVVGLFLYQFSAYLLGRLLGVDNDIKKFDKALFGSNWERSEEEEHRTRF
jgi:hypothetical protein